MTVTPVNINDLIIKWLKSSKIVIKVLAKSVVLAPERLGLILYYILL